MELTAVPASFQSSWFLPSGPRCAAVRSWASWLCTKNCMGQLVKTRENGSAGPRTGEPGTNSENNQWPNSLLISFEACLTEVSETIAVFKYRTFLLVMIQAPTVLTLRGVCSSTPVPAERYVSLTVTNGPFHWCLLLLFLYTPMTTPTSYVLMAAIHLLSCWVGSLSFLCYVSSKLTNLETSMMTKSYPT